MRALQSVDVATPSWATVACESLTTVASTALLLPTTLLGPVAPPSGDVIGAYIPIMTPGESLQIGIVADPTSCGRLVGALLQMPPDEEVSPDDVPDAFGEIANMVAGMTKAAMAAVSGLVGLGLPMVIHGWVAPSDGLELECMGAEVGSATLTIVLVRRRTNR
ncbi:MAG: chemotaxis protein CheX [Proteobacteria bacterium]|nr:chemotaxis protein CheX [Pseudomonadota bacterium]